MIELYVVTLFELYAYATNTRACDFSVIVFIFTSFRPSTPIRYVCAFVLIHIQECFQIDAFSMKTLSVLVWTEGLKGA